MIVIPMAGAGSRFSRAGYTQPKWALPLAGRPLFDWSLSSFESSFDTERFLIVHQDDADTAAAVRERLEVLGIANATLVGLHDRTRGQADTVALGLQRAQVTDSEPLTVFNIDTVRLRYRPDPLTATCDGLVECFSGEGDHWSFVEPAPAGERRVTRVVEKQRISNLCSTGLYFFGDAGLFFEAFEREEAAPQMPELYVAPLFDRMVAAGHDVRYSVVDGDDLVLSGTPAEYERARLQLEQRPAH